MILVTRIQSNFQLSRPHLSWCKISVYLQSQKCLLHVQDAWLTEMCVTEAQHLGRYC